MKGYVLGLAAALAIVTGGVTAANAVELDVGPGGVRIGEHRHHGYDRGYRAYGAYRGGGCRVVIDRHVNRFGERVVVKRRICD